MKRLDCFWKSPLFRQFFKRYLIVFVLPVVLLTVLMFSFSNSAVRNAIFSAQQAITAQQQLSIDNEARQYRTLGAELPSDAMLGPLLRRGVNEMTSADIYRLYTLRKQLSNRTSSFAGADTTIVYLWESGYCLQPQRALPLSEFYESIEGQFYAPSSFGSFVSLLDASPKGKWISVEDVSGLPHLYFQITLPSVKSRQKLTLLVPINVEYLKKLLQPSDDTTSVCILSGDDYGLIYAVGSQTPLLPDDLPQTQSWQRETSDALLSCRQLQNTNDYVLCVYDLHTVLAPLYATQRISIIFILTFLLIGAVLTFIVTIRNFNPIRQLVGLLPGDDGISTDEYTRLRMALMEGMEEKTRLLWHITLDSQRKKDEALYKQLRSHQGIRALFPDGEQGAVCAARVVLIDYTGDAANAQVIVQQSLIDGMDSSFSPRTLCIGLDLLLVFCIELGKDGDYSALCRALRGTLQYLRVSKAIECAAVLTRPHPFPDASMDILSREIDETFAIRKNDDSLTVCSADTAVSSLKVSMAITTEHLFSASNDGNSDSAKVLLDTLRRQSDQLIEQCMPEKSAAESDDEAYLKRIIEIVSQQCTDPMLSVGSIADQLGCKPDVVSRMFKKNMKLGLLDYIHHTRITISRKLIDSEEEKTITAIAEEVGYLSADSFIRSFKRIVGMTPGAYRNRTKTIDESAQGNGTNS